MIDQSLEGAIKHRDRENLKAKRHCDLFVVRKNAEGVWVLKQWRACNGPIKREAWNTWYCSGCKCLMSIGKQRRITA